MGDQKSQQAGLPMNVTKSKFLQSNIFSKEFLVYFKSNVTNGKNDELSHKFTKISYFRNSTKTFPQTWLRPGKSSVGMNFRARIQPRRTGGLL